jgi:hypothetical protein
MALADQIKLLAELDSLGKDIPGLDIDKIVNNLVEKADEIKAQVEVIEKVKEENMERGMTEEEAEAKVQEAKDQAIEEAKKQIEPMVKEEVTKMKQEYTIAKEAIDSIPGEVETIMAATVIPPAISTPPSTANPLYTLKLALQAKKGLTKTLNIVLAALTKVIMIANKLKFALPQPILDLVKALGTVTGTLDKIPG